MIDREKVIKGLKSELLNVNDYGDCTAIKSDCPYTGVDCHNDLIRDALALLKAQEPIEARLHLCESCAKEYPECDATVDGIEFGSRVGNDNIIGCTAYVNRWKARTTDAQKEAVKRDDT